MAVTFVASSAVATGTNPTVSLPAGVVEKDLLLLITTGTATPTTPAGWTQRSAQGANGFITVLFKFATGTEAASVAVTVAGTTTKAVMLAYRGASAIDTVSGFTTATAATSLAPGLTGNAFANELEISVYAGNNAVGVWGAAPSPTTSRVSSDPTAAVNGLLIVDETQAAAGNSTARTGTISTAHTLSSVAIAIIPSGRYWVGGTGTWTTTTTNWAFSSGGASGAPAPTANDPVTFDQAATYTVTLTGALTCFGMTVSAGTVTFSSTGTITNSGSMSLSSSTVWSATGLITFNSTSTGRTVTTNGVTINSPITFDGVAGVWSLGSALSTGVTLTTTLNNGTLTLNGFDLNTGSFSSSVATARSIAFGSNNIVLNQTTAASTVLNMATATLFTYTGTGGFTSAAAVTKTYVFGTTGGSATNAPNLTLTGSGTAVQTFTTASWFGTLSFGTTAFNPGTTALSIAGGLTLSTGGTFTTLGVTMVGTGTITPNGKTIAAFTVNTAGTVTLAGALGATTYTHTAGTINFATFNLTCSGAASVAFGTLNNIGTISCTTWAETGTFVLSSGTISASVSFTVTSGSFTYSGGTITTPSFVHTAGTVTTTIPWTMTTNSTYTLTAGTLTLGGNLTTGIFSSSGAGVRSIAFSTYNIILAHTTAGTTVLAASTTTNYTQTSTGGGFSSDASITRTFTFGVTGSTAGQVPNLTLTGSGTAVQTITSGSNFNQLDFGTTAFTLPATSLFVNALILSSGGTFTNLSVTTANTTGGTITTNNRPIAVFQNGFSAAQFGNSTLVGNLTCTTFVNNTLSTINFGGYNVTCSGTFTHLGTDITNLGTISCTTFTINGPTFTMTSGTITPSVSFVLTAGTFNYNGGTLSPVPTFTHTAGTVSLGRNYSLTSTGTYTLVAGTLTMTDRNLTAAAFITSGTGTRSINFGTSGYGEITVTGNNTTIWDGGGAGITYTGTPRIYASYTGSVGTRTVNLGTAWTEANAFDVTVQPSSYPFVSGFQILSTGGNPTDTVAISGVAKAFNMVNFSFAVTPGVMTIYGNYNIPSVIYSGTINASASTTTFAATTTQNIQIDRAVDLPITFNGVGGTFTLNATTTGGPTKAMTLTAGSLVLNGSSSISTGTFVSTGTSTRSINFNSNNITLTNATAATTVLSMADATNFTIAGSGGFISDLAVTKTFSFGSTAGGSAANAPNLTFTTGAAIPTITTGSWFNSLNFGSTTSTPAATAISVGTLTLASGGTYTGLTPTFTSSQTWTPQFSKQLAGLGVNIPGGTLTLGGSQSLIATATTTLTSGTLDLNGNDLTTGIFSSSNTNTRAIAFGSNNIILSHTTAAQTVLAMADATNFTWTASTGGFRSDLAVTRTFQFGSTAGGLATNAPNLAITSGAAIPTITTNSWFNALNFTGTTSTPAAATVFVSTLTLATGGTYTALTPIFTRTQTWTTQFSKQLGGIGFNLAGGTLTLGDSPSLVATSTTTLTAGTLDLGGFNLTTGIFSSTNANTRSIAFGSNNIILSHTTAAQTVLSMAIATGFTYTGTGGFTTDASVTRTCVFGTTGGSRTNAPNLSLTGTGVAIVTLTTGSWFNNLSFGSTAFALAATTLNIDGNLTLSTGGTFTALTLNMVGTGTITSNAKPILALTIDNVSGTTTLGDALTLGATAATTLTSGNLALNGFTLTTGTFSSSNTNSRSIAFGSSNIVLATTTALAVNLGMAVADNFTYTTSGTFGSGTGCFQSTMSVTRTFQFGTTSGGLATNAPILYLASGASIATLTTGSWFREVNFGTTAFTIAATNLNLSNIYSPSSTSVLTALTATMVGTGSIQTNTTIGPLVINTSGITTTLVGATTLCTTAALTLGTLDLSNRTLTCSSTFTYNGGSLLFGTGTLNCTTFTQNGPTLNLTSGNLSPSTSFVLTTGALTIDGTATLGAVPTFTHTAGTVTFNKSYGLTTTGTYTLASGNLTLAAGVILTTGVFSSSNTATRSIGFGASISPASGSVLFDGTSQYLSTTGTTSGPLDLATGAPNWAVECWFNLANTTSDHAVFWKGGTTGTVNPSYAFFVPAGGVGQWIVGDGAAGGYVQNTSVTFLANTWYHFALVRNGSTLTAYINGVAQTPVTITTAIANTGNNALSIGSSAADGSTRYFAGNISNFRIVKGAAVYTGNFTPVGPLASSQNARVNVTVVTLAQTSLLLNTVNGANFITDSSSYAATLTNVGTATSSASYPFTYPLLSNINLTHTTAATVVLSMADLTNYSYTGTSLFTVESMTNTRTLTYGTTGGSVSNATDLTFTTGASVATLTTGSWYKNLNFGTTSFNPGTTTLNIVNSLTLSATGAYLTLTPTPQANVTYTFNSASFGPLAINTTFTVTLGSAASCTTFAMTAGTLNFASYNLTCSGAATYTGGTLSNISTIACTTFTINGPSFIFTSGTINPSTGFTLTAGSFTLGGTASIGLFTGTFTHTAGTVTFNKTYAFATTATYLLTAGTLNIASGLTMYVGIFSSANANSRSIAFGTSSEGYVNLTGTGTVLSMATLTGFTWSGPGGFQSDNASVGTSTFTCGSTAGGSTTTAPNLTFSSAGGANVQTLTTASWFNNLNFGTTAFNPGTTALNITGSLTLSASGTYTTMTPTMLGTGNITSNGAAIAGLVINSTSGTTSLRSALATTATGTTTLTSGTLALNSFDLSTGIFSSSGAVARSVSFGTTSSAITGSAYFNGTNQYFSAASNTAYEFATGDFTVEAWINLTTTAATWAGICQSDPFGTRSTNNFEFYLADNPVGRLVFSDGFQTSQITIPFSPVANAWYHVAVTRQSGVMRMFVNGVSGTLTQSGTDPGTISWNQNGIVSGYNSSNGGYFPGYISNLRVVKGVAVYTGNFTLPSSPLAATQSSSTNISAITGTQTSLLLNTAYGVDFLADSSTYNSAITNNSAVTSSKTSPYRSNINLTHTTAATTVLSMATATGFTYTGTGGFVVPAMTNTRTFNVGATAGGSLTTAPNLTFTTGASVATLTTGSWFDNLDFGTTTFNPGTTALNITGDLTLSSTGTYTTMTPTMVGTGTITSNTNTTLAALTINSTSGTTSLGDAFSLSATGTTTLTSGTLAMNKFNLTTGIFSSSGAVTRSIAFGGSTAATSASFDGSTQYASYAINSNIKVTANQPFTVEFWIYTPTQVQTAPAVFGTSNDGGQTGDTAFFVGHSGLGITNQYGFYVAGLTNGIGGSGTTNNLLASTGNYIRNAWTHIALVRVGADALGMYINGVLNGTATYSGAINFPTNTLWVGTSGNNFPGSHYTGYISNFRWVTGVAVYTGNFAVPTSPLTATQSSGTNISAITGTQTSLLLNTVTGANILADSSSNNYTPTNVGSVAGIFYNPFAGVINLAHTTAATTVLNMATATAFTLSGTGGFTATAAITRTYVFGTTGGSAAISPNLWLTGSGTAIATITTASWFNLLDFGTTAFTIAATALNLNALTLSTGGTFTNLTPTMVGTGTITTNGKTLPALTVNTAGTATLAGALTLSGALTLTQGTLASSTYPVTSATFASTGTATRSMTGSGTYTISGAGATAFSNASATGITITGLIISMTAATAKTFAGGGGSYSTLNQGGAGALTISGNNSFSDLTATTRPSTITFTAGSTQTFADFTLSGVLGSLVTINSSAAGTRANLSKSSGTVSVGYLSIQDSAAIGGAGWYAGTTSTNVSNNLGWVFTAPPAPGSVYLGNFFAFF